MNTGNAGRIARTLYKIKYGEVNEHGEILLFGIWSVLITSSLLTAMYYRQMISPSPTLQSSLALVWLCTTGTMFVSVVVANFIAFVATPFITVHWMQWRLGRYWLHTTGKKFSTTYEIIEEALQPFADKILETHPRDSVPDWQTKEFETLYEVARALDGQPPDLEYFRKSRRLLKVV